MLSCNRNSNERCTVGPLSSPRGEVSACRGKHRHLRVRLEESRFDTAGAWSLTQKMRGAWNAPSESCNTCLGHRLGSRFCFGSWLFTLLRSELCRDCFLYFFDIHPETLRGIHEQVLRFVSPLIG